MSSLSSFQIPEDLAHSQGMHETVKVLKEYAEVSESVVRKGCVLNLDAVLSLLLLALCLKPLAHSYSQNFIFLLCLLVENHYYPYCSWLTSKSLNVNLLYFSLLP